MCWANTAIYKDLLWWRLMALAAKGQSLELAEALKPHAT